MLENKKKRRKFYSSTNAKKSPKFKNISRSKFLIEFFECSKVIGTSNNQEMYWVFEN